MILKSPLFWVAAALIVGGLTTIKMLHTDLQELRTENGELAGEVSQLTSDLQSTESELQRRRAELEDQQEINAERSERVGQLTGEIGDLRQRVSTLSILEETDHGPETEQENCSFYRVPLPGSLIDILREGARDANGHRDEERTDTTRPSTSAALLDHRALIPDDRGAVGFGLRDRRVVQRHWKVQRGQRSATKMAR